MTFRRTLLIAALALSGATLTSVVAPLAGTKSYAVTFYDKDARA